MFRWLSHGTLKIDDERKIATESAIRWERHRLKQSVQNIESGSRVLQSMAGMMRLISLNGQIKDD